MRVVKRDGREVAFDDSKISDAVSKAFKAVGERDTLNTNLWIAMEITENFICGGKNLHIEEVQNKIELLLMQEGFHAVAQAYIAYRTKRNLSRSPKILDNPDSYVIKYPEMVEFTRYQLEDIYWTANEHKVEKDKQDLKTKLSPSQLHGVMTVLKLFVKYELHVGTDYWLGRFSRIFKRPEFRRWAATAGMVELAIHAPFYNRINEVLLCDNEEFHASWKDSIVLRQRMEFIEAMVKHPDDLVSLAAFSMIEGAVLYTSFAFLKSFQSNGFNLIGNIVAGVNFSVRDELHHATVGAWAFNRLLAEKNISPIEREKLFEQIFELGVCILTHELQVIDMIFSEGDMQNISRQELRAFAEHRINRCLSQLQVIKEHDLPKDNAIAKWFYAGEKGYIYHDFFNKVGRQYTRSWNEKGFTW